MQLVACHCPRKLSLVLSVSTLEGVHCIWLSVQKHTVFGLPESNNKFICIPFTQMVLYLINEKKKQQDNRILRDGRGNSHTKELGTARRLTQGCKLQIMVSSGVFFVQPILDWTLRQQSTSAQKPIGSAVQLRAFLVFCSFGLRQWISLVCFCSRLCLIFFKLSKPDLSAIYCQISAHDVKCITVNAHA